MAKLLVGCLALFGGLVLIAVVAAVLFFSGATWGISEIISQPDKLERLVVSAEESRATMRAAEVRPGDVSNGRRDVGCELQYQYITVGVPAELVRGRVDGFRGQPTSFEPVDGANRYFDRAGCDQKFEWRRGQDDETVTIHVLASDWPNEEAVLAALVRGEPVYGVLADCGNPIVLNAHRLPATVAPSGQSAQRVEPTVTSRPVLATPPRRDEIMPAATAPATGGCAAFEGGACLP